MPHFLKKPKVTGNKFLALSLLASITLSPFAVMSQPADLEVFNNAYDKIAANGSSQLKAPSEQQKQTIKQLLNGAGMTAPVASITPSKLPSMYQVTLAQTPEQSHSRHYTLLPMVTTSCRVS